MTSGPIVSHAPFDLLLRGGTLIDGAADAVPTVTDVGILGDRIVAIGTLADESAREVARVDGRVVAPGFIDPHTHVEPALLDGRPEIDAPIMQGVTTCLLGADGFGWAPLPEPAARQLWASTAGINGPYPDGLETSTVERYLGRLAARSPFHVLPQIPHHAIRFGAAGWADGHADPDRLGRMREGLAEWLAAGATGLAVGLDYEPGARADTAEIVALCETVGRAGGSLAAHIRYQDIGRDAAWAEVADIAVRSDCRLVVAHERLDDIGASTLARARRSIDAWVERYPYEAASTHLAIYLRRADQAGGPPATAARLADAVARARIADALDEDLGVEAAAGDRFVIAASTDPARIGVDLAEAAAEAGVTLGAFAADLLHEDPEVLLIVHHDRSDGAAETMRTLADPAAIVASDGLYVPGLVHPRGAGTFPRVLRTALDGDLPGGLVGAIHAMTGRTAAAYRVPDRGRIVAGAVADIVVFDPETVRDLATWTAPRRAPQGIEHVLVGGRFAVRDGLRTPALAGSLLAAGAPATA